jgi:hypothetical protein
MSPLQRFGVGAAIGWCLCAHAAQDGPFYCGSKIIDVGMTTEQVRSYCGIPTSESTEGREVRDNKSRVLGVTRIDRWKYASYNATRMLVFIDGKLQSIERF